MERVPFDVWDLILAHACTDGGRAGAALSATSRHIRASSASFRFYSLKLTRLDQISQLILSFERIKRSSIGLAIDDNSERTLGTRHLLLSFLPGDNDHVTPPSREWTEYSRNRRKQRAQVEEDERAHREAKDTWDRQFEYVVRRLLDLVRPTLKTLAVLQSPEIALPYVGTTFPVLRELSLLADDRMLVRPDVRWDRAPFPELARLHVVYEGSKEHPWEKTLPLWGGLAPAVTHLRLSQASKLIPTRFFGHSRFTAANSRATLAFSALKKVIVQPFVLTPVRGHEYQEERERLRRVPRSSLRDGPTVIVLRGRWYRGGYWRDRLRWDWEARMLGELGCWGEREEDEGEWAYERKKRAEVALEKTKAQALAAKRASTGRVVSMIRFD